MDGGPELMTLQQEMLVCGQVLAWFKEMETPAMHSPPWAPSEVQQAKAQQDNHLLYVTILFVAIDPPL